MVVLQSLAQARAGWQEEGAALLDFTDAVVVMGGVSDKETCETISRRIGNYDRPVQTIGEASGTGLLTTIQPSRTESWTTRREAAVPADQVARVPFGQALLIVGTGWEYVPTTPYEKHPCFQAVLADVYANMVPAPVEDLAISELDFTPARAATPTRG